MGTPIVMLERAALDAATMLESVLDAAAGAKAAASFELVPGAARLEAAPGLESALDAAVIGAPDEPVAMRYVDLVGVDDRVTVPIEAPRRPAPP